ncbi:helicase-related protein [Bacteriovorax sp. PP10]|uniref:RNA helicase n=1 Tax=Bacteriovorax antarcticus TaxID=3088717 RepID=A0ABU5VQA0_9BACT|nr:helicase-related protein [Bacteriovorax sp. PP10]MEA9355224.1 helicase-related protein [Bacteriovorax sp. PP10]
MSTTDFPALPDYQGIRNLLDTERKTLIKIHSFAENDDYLRTNEDAEIVLNFVEKTQTALWNVFKTYPSLVSIFNTEYVNFYEFLQRENVVSTIFVDDCLMPEKEIFFFGQDGGLVPAVLDLHYAVLKKWVDGKEVNHVETQKLVKENFNLELKTSNLTCQCVACLADYRTRVREVIFEECSAAITETKTKIEEQIASQKGDAIADVTVIYQNMLRSLDKKFQQAQFRLKKSSLNRLESQIKVMTEETFTYPSGLAKDHANNLILYFHRHLSEEGLSPDLVSDEEYHRFFKQLSSNIWRHEKYLVAEFKKLIKSILVLKRKDISSNILQEYLGQFWIHSHARKIPRKIIYHMGPTNSGKTYHAIQALAGAQKGCYLAPLRLLAAELYDTLNAKGAKTTLLTGEEVIEVEGATHYSSTIEMAKLNEEFTCAVIDEIQMITDKQRGWAWTRALVNLHAYEVHICGDGSVLNLIKQITELCGDELEVRNYTRMTELVVEDKPITLAQLQKSDALIVFSRRNALKYKYDLEQVGFKVSIIYGMLSPEVRREQARKFDKGLTDVIVSTDAISMGMNLPIKRIVFSTLTKHINSQEYPITASEIKQIAGRAGRFQRFPVGGVTCLQKVEDGIAEISDALTSTLDQQTQSMVGPDLDIFTKVNNALSSNNLPILRLSEFLRLFNTMTFTKPFYCVELKEMIELAETVEDIDSNNVLSSAEIFGFACAPVNLGLLEHVQYYVWMLKKYVTADIIKNEHINFASNEIDYLETTIKCVELYQWLARHFNGKNFEFDEKDLLENKLAAVDKLNILLSDKITPSCSSCGAKLPDTAKFAICEECFQQRRFTRRPPMNRRGPPGKGGDRPSHLASAVGSTKENFRQGKPSKKRKFAGKPKK